MEYQTLAAMPKFELHVHVEGAADADTYYEIAHKNNFQLPVKSRQEWRQFFEFRDFPHFIDGSAVQLDEVATVVVLYCA